MTWNVDDARARFPGLRSEWALLDNAGGSQILGRAIERVREFLVESNVQLGGPYEPSRVAEARVRAGWQAVAAWLGAPEGTDVVLGGSAAQLIASLAASIAWRPGDEVVVTDCDHVANVAPWRRLEARGVTVKTWRVDRESGRLRPETLEPLFGPRTRLVCFAHVSNVLGVVNDVAAIARLAHAAGAQVCVDGVAYAPHRRPAVGDWDVDYYAVSLYKTYGPHLSALYGKRLGDEVMREAPYELTHALPVVCEYLAALPEDAVAAHGAALTARLIGWLRGRRGVRLVSAPEVPTVSFVVDGRDPGEVAARVARRKVGLKGGHFNAQPLMAALGAPGVVRASMVHYNTEDEVDRLIAALDEAL